MNIDGDSLLNDESSPGDLGSQTSSKDLLDDADLAGARDADIRLRTSIDLSALMESRGVLLEPELPEEDEDDVNFSPENVANYYDNIYPNMIRDDNANDDEDFTANFAEKALSMQRVTEDGGIRKKVVRKGLDAFGTVPPTATVTVHYELFIEYADNFFDSTRIRGRPERFRLDSGRLFLGLSRGLETMQKGEVAHFLFSPAYAFGELGCAPRIPANAEIFAVVELVDFVTDNDVESLLLLLPEERNRVIDFNGLQKKAAELHLKGNEYVDKLKEWKLAAKCYLRAIRLLEEANLANEEDENLQKRQLLKLYNNLGYTYNKLLRFEPACSVLQKALLINSKDVKANFRMAVAKRNLHNFDHAKYYLTKAGNIDPQNPEIGREQIKLDEQMRKEKEINKQMCVRMFNSAKSSAATQQVAGPHQGGES